MGRIPLSVAGVLLSARTDYDNHYQLVFRILPSCLPVKRGDSICDEGEKVEISLVFLMCWKAYSVCSSWSTISRIVSNPDCQKSSDAISTPTLARIACGASDPPVLSRSRYLGTNVAPSF